VGLSFSPDGSTLATAGFDQHIRIWDTQHGTLRALLRGSQRQIYALARSADGHLLASAGQDGTIWLWEWQPERVRHIFRGHGMVVTSVAFSPDGSILASGSADRTLRLWDVQTGSELHRIDGEVQIAYGLVFSHAGTRFATVNGGEILHIWNASTGQLIQQFHSPTVMTGIDMSPNDTQIVTCGEQTVRIWDLASATNTLTIRHSRGLGPVFFTPDGTTLVTGSDDGHIRLWDAQTGALLRALPTPGPYHNMNMTGATGITDIQRATLQELGAYEEP
jgi:WD40 repeat protein